MRVLKTKNKNCYYNILKILITLPQDQVFMGWEGGGVLGLKSFQKFEIKISFIPTCNLMP